MRRADYSTGHKQADRNPQSSSAIGAEGTSEEGREHGTGAYSCLLSSRPRSDLMAPWFVHDSLGAIAAVVLDHSASLDDHENRSCVFDPLQRI